MENTNIESKVSNIDIIPERGDSNDYWYTAVVRLDREEATLECSFDYDWHSDEAIEILERFVGRTVADLISGSSFAFTVVRPPVEFPDDERPF